MIQAAGRVILCLDHSKFGRKSVLPMCGLEEIDVVVTDSGAPAELVEALRGRDLEVIVAGGMEIGDRR
jgi:DeoR/GlpR family transcriptional regulator of sugar metabolism